MVQQDDVAMKSSVKAVLAVDLGESSVKILATAAGFRQDIVIEQDIVIVIEQDIVIVIEQDIVIEREDR
jgi:hypothetical protein